MAVTNWHRENIYGYKIDSEQPSFEENELHRVDISVDLRLSGGNALEECERILYIEALQSYKGSKVAAAKALGVSRRTAYNKIKKFKLEYLVSGWTKEIIAKRNGPNF